MNCQALIFMNRCFSFRLFESGTPGSDRWKSLRKMFQRLFGMYASLHPEARDDRIPWLTERTRQPQATKVESLKHTGHLKIHSQQKFKKSNLNLQHNFRKNLDDLKLPSFKAFYDQKTFLWFLNDPKCYVTWAHKHVMKLCYDNRSLFSRDGSPT